MAQCRCDPPETIAYYTALTEIVAFLQANQEPIPNELEIFIISEQERGRINRDEVETAARFLGFGEQNSLLVDLDADVEHRFVISAWEAVMKEAWKFHTADEAIAKQKQATKCLQVLAKDRKDKQLYEVAEASIASELFHVIFTCVYITSFPDIMKPDDAYQFFGIPQSMDDADILPVFEITVFSHSFGICLWCLIYITDNGRCAKPTTHG